MCKLVCGSKSKNQWITKLTFGNFLLELQAYNAKLISTYVNFENIQINALTLHMSIKLWFLSLNPPLFFQIFPFQQAHHCKACLSEVFLPPAQYSNGLYLGKLNLLLFLWHKKIQAPTSYHKTVLTEVSKWKGRGVSAPPGASSRDPPRTLFWETAWLLCANGERALYCWLACKLHVCRGLGHSQMGLNKRWYYMSSHEICTPV